MQSDRPDLIALLGSRICHDLISPLSAIGNGVELLMMSGAVPGPEIALISESVTNANARIRYFRIAYGSAAPGQSVARAEIRSILDDMTRGGRLAIDWQVPGDVSRIEAKLAFLALQCLETALPYGGRIRIAADGDIWRIGAEAAKMKLDAGLWERLTTPGAGTEVAAAHVQFLLFPAELQRQGRTLTLQTADQQIAMRY
ncbi:MAG: histidine phosphotransferase [Rhodobacterales bacterium 32-67-9]|nr:MAG: histidine phosphotransferase [Rhodobacterales bacterium 32-67-9]